jgi:hypothetical protein
MTELGSGKFDQMNSRLILEKTALEMGKNSNGESTMDRVMYIQILNLIHTLIVTSTNQEVVPVTIKDSSYDILPDVCDKVSSVKKLEETLLQERRGKEIWNRPDADLQCNWQKSKQSKKGWCDGLPPILQLRLLSDFQ